MIKLRTSSLPHILTLGLLVFLATTPSVHAADTSEDKQAQTKTTDTKPSDTKVQHVQPDGDLVLTDGRILHLRGIRIAVPHNPKGTVDAITKLVADKPLQLMQPDKDRYDRVEADVMLPDKTDLQDALLDSGSAFVLPVTGGEPRLAQMMEHEETARTAHRGIWADTAYADISADDAKDKIGSFAFVRFKVQEAGYLKTTVYLNAGADHHDDFTIAIRNADLRAFKTANIDPLTYQGKTIRVRGWLVKRSGALINVTTPAQIEIVK